MITNPEIKNQMTDQMTDKKEQQYHPYRLLGVIALVIGTFAVICYAIQIHYLG